LDIKKPWNRNLPQDCQKFAGAALKKISERFVHLGRKQACHDT
jgi:hypothetical protein